MSVKQKTTGALTVTGSAQPIVAANASVSRMFTSFVVHDPDGVAKDVSVFVNAKRVDFLQLSANDKKTAVVFGAAPNEAVTMTVSAGSVTVDAIYTERSGGDM